MRKKLVSNILYPILALVVFILLWTVIAIVYNKPLLLPNFTQVLVEFGKLLGTGTFYVAIAMTFLRVIAGFVISAIIAFVLAELSAINVNVNKFLRPFIVIMRALPTMSVILLISVWFNSQLTPIVVSVLIACPLLYTAFVNRLTVDNQKVNEMCSVFKVSIGVKLFRLYPRILLPQLLRQSSSVMSLTLKVVIAGEVLAYTANSIGMEMYASKLNVLTAQLLAWTLSAVLLSFAIEGIVALIKYLLYKGKVVYSYDKI